MKTVILGLGFIGSALAKKLPKATAIRTSSDSLRLDKDSGWIYQALEGADTVFMCAGSTGGVGKMATDPFSFIYPNIRIYMNVFEACEKAGVKRVVCPGSTTGYPNSPEEMDESRFLEGDLHPAYNIPGNVHRFVKRLSLVHSFETLFFRPSHVYGPGNDFNPQTSHVVEAVVRKVAEKQDPFVIWGNGEAIRDGIYIDDFAEAMALATDPEVPPGDYNVGTGVDTSVNRMVEILCNYANHYPDIIYDLSKPTAIPARRVSTKRLRSMGWEPKVSMEEGLKRTYSWYLTTS